MAQSFVQSSFDEPAATMRINTESQLNIESIRRHDTKIRMNIARSSGGELFASINKIPTKATFR